MSYHRSILSLIALVSTLIFSSSSAPANSSQDVSNFFLAKGPFSLELNANEDSIIDAGDMGWFQRGDTLYRINAGGPEYQRDGVVWQADTGFFNQGQTSSTANGIGGTLDGALYQTERYDDLGGPDLQYQFNVAPGKYAVRLHFAEIFLNSPGARVFGVELEGRTVESGLDIYDEAGGAFQALVKEYQAWVFDGEVTIDFRHITENPKVSAIEIVEVVRPANLGTTVLRLNAGGNEYTDPFGQTWSPEGSFVSGGTTFSAAVPVDGTSMETLYQSERYGNFGYAIGLNPGRYTVRAHFAELSFSQANQRTFNLSIEGQQVLSNYDIFVDAGFSRSRIQHFDAWVSDGTLNIDFSSVINNAKLSAIEIIENKAMLGVTPDVVAFPRVEVGTPERNQVVAITNTTPVPVYITGVGIDPIPGTSATPVTVQFQGVFYTGGASPTTYQSAGFIAPGATDFLRVFYSSAANAVTQASIRLQGTARTINIPLTGAVGDEDLHPYLRPVITVPPVIVDYNQDGVETVALSGEGSFSLSPTNPIQTYEWRDGANNLFATGPTASPNFNVGNDLTVKLTVKDNSTPAEMASTTAEFDIVPTSQIPGVLVHLYLNEGSGPEFIIDNPPAIANYAYVSNAFSVANVNGQIGPSDLDSNTMVRMRGTIQVSEGGSYEFITTGGTASTIIVNGSEANGPVNLAAGTVTVDARIAVPQLANLPVELRWNKNGQGAQAIASSLVTHDQSTVRPTINSITPNTGNVAGNEQVTITGLGFFPYGSVDVTWADTVIDENSATINPTSIVLNTPPGSGLVSVRVNNPNGTSNTRTYQYIDPNVPQISFSLTDLAFLTGPTCAAFGPDGRLYVGTFNYNDDSGGGAIYAYTFDDNYNVVNTQTINKIATLSNEDVLGIGFNPFDPPDPVRIYVGHSELYAINGGACPGNAFASYLGRVTRLTGPNYDFDESIIRHLPVSNHDHGVNGIDFDNEGNMYVAVGGNTNAGVKACSESVLSSLGGLPETPLSAAIVKAEIWRNDYNGELTYVEDLGGGLVIENMNQQFGESVEIGNGTGVSVYSSGFRNPFDVIFTTKGYMYTVDNGPNFGFGPASTSISSQGPDPEAPNELNFVEQGMYYGHPNRNRGRKDARQAVYRGPFQASIPGVYQAPAAIFNPAANGLVEYRSNTFNGQMRGDLVVVERQNGNTYRVKMSPDGRTVTQTNDFVDMNCLTLVQGPGGVIIGTSFSGNKLVIAKPNDQNVTSLQVYDIHPWRAPATGGHPFVIGGKNFGDIGNTSVTIGGIPAQITSVSPTRIKGIIPANNFAPDELLTVSVTKGGSTVQLPDAFLYLGGDNSDNGARGLVEIDPGSNMNESSTYIPNSFKLWNISSGNQKINKVTIDLRTAIFPDMVFDPFANAGDSVGKAFELNANSAGGSITPSYVSAHDGGFDILEIAFNSFDPNDNITFSIDVDPTTINGSNPPGPNHSGSISGIELIGSTVTFEFDDGTVLTTQPFIKNGSDTGSANAAKPIKAATPSIEVLGVTTVPADTTEANHTVRISGPNGSNVELLVIEASLYTAGVPGGGFDIDPYEANTVTKITEKFATITANNFVDVPITLTKSDNEGGYNYIVASIRDGEGDYGSVSETIVLKYD